MNDERCVFHLSQYDAGNLLLQASDALESMTETASRNHLPGVWHVIDAIGANRKPPRVSPFTPFLSLICLVLGVVLFVPGLTNPQELLVPLLAGALGIGAGVGGFVRLKRAKRNPFEKAAKKLLEHVNAQVAAHEEVVVSFTEANMVVAADQDVEQIPIDRFEHTVQTEDLLLIVYDGRVMLLQKRDLCRGDIESLKCLLPDASR